MSKHSPSDLLTPQQASEALGGHVGTQMLRKHIRMGKLKAIKPRNRDPRVMDGRYRILIRRSDLMKFYAYKIKMWEGAGQ